MCCRPWGLRESDTAPRLNSCSDGRRPRESRVIIPVVLASRPLPRPQGVQPAGTQAGDTPAAWLSLSPSWDDGGGLQRSSLSRGLPHFTGFSPRNPNPDKTQPQPPPGPLCLDSLPPSGTSVAAPEGGHALNRVSGGLHSAEVPPCPSRPLPRGLPSVGAAPQDPGCLLHSLPRVVPSTHHRPEGCPAACGYYRPPPPGHLSCPAQAPSHDSSGSFTGSERSPFQATARLLGHI